MNRLSAAALLQIWEVAEGCHPVDQALTILGVAYPTIAPTTLATLSVGQRDAYLLALYSQTFGPQADALADCPHCREALTFVLPLPAMQLTPPAPLAPTDEPQERAHHVAIEDYELAFRLPNSFDLAALAQQAQAVATGDGSPPGHALLLQRCVLAAIRTEQPVAATELPAPVVTALAAAMAAVEPQAEILLNLTCPACGQPWQALFDIVPFFWANVRQQAKRLLNTVHRLAYGYGWSEAEILALSPLRRQFYLDQLR